MPPRERNTRPGLQITLKRERTSFVGKLDDDVDTPRPALRRVGTAARVVFGMRCRQIAGNVFKAAALSAPCRAGILGQLNDFWEAYLIRDRGVRRWLANRRSLRT
jgi:hypothetical protein